MTRKSYPSDLSDLEWEIVKPFLLPPVKNRGRKRETDQREIINAILYLLNEGCKWRSLSFCLDCHNALVPPLLNPVKLSFLMVKPVSPSWS